MAFGYDARRRLGRDEDDRERLREKIRNGEPLNADERELACRLLGEDDEGQLDNPRTPAEAEEQERAEARRQREQAEDRAIALDSTSPGAFLRAVALVERVGVDRNRALAMDSTKDVLHLAARKLGVAHVPSSGWQAIIEAHARNRSVMAADGNHVVASVRATTIAQDGGRGASDFARRFPTVAAVRTV